MKFRIEEIVLRTIKADAFEQTFGSFTANNIRHLCEEKP